MPDIIEGMFGVDPNQLRMQRYQQMQQQNMQMAHLDPFQRANAQIANAAGGATMLGAKAMGLKTRDEQVAEARQEMAAMIREGDPKSYLEAAEKARQLGFQNDAVALINKAHSLDQEIIKNNQTIALTQKALREPPPKIETIETGVEGKPQMRRKMERQEDGTWKQVGPEYLARSDGSGGSGVPKGLTREAKLKWELDNGFIDQVTYDAAISATPGYKLRDERVSSAKLTELGFKSIEDNISKLYDEETGKIKPSANPLFGKFDQYRPDLVMSQDTINASKALKSLTNQVMMANLADAKERVGQSFGSMQVQEWDKFTEQLTSLDRGLSPTDAASAMKYVSSFIKTKRDILKKALNADPSTANKDDKGKGTPSLIPKLGEVRNGFRFKGGNPNEKENWVRVK